jgi:hypothetical protein
VIDVIAMQETIFKILSKLGDSEPPVRKAALECSLKIIGHGTGSISRLYMECVESTAARVKEILQTKQCVLHLMEMLHGRDEDEVILELVDGLAKQLDGTQHLRVLAAFKS